MSPDASLYLITYEARPNPEMENPAGNLGAYIACFLRADSWDHAEHHLLAILPGQGWIPDSEISRGLVTRSDVSDDSLAYFDQALEHGISLNITAWDEEDPAEQPEEDELTSAMISSAQQVVGFGAESNVELDFSEESLVRLDHLIPALHPNGATFDSTLVVYAAYVGEVLRRNLGGHWKKTEEHGLHFEGANFKAGPLKWTREKFADPANTSIAFKYKALKNLLQGTDTPLSPVPPAPIQVPGEDGDSEKDVQAIQRAPLVIFLLVAAADGQVDPKEALKFKQVLAKSSQHPNRLFKVAAGAVQEGFEENLRYVSEAGFLAWPIFLTQAKEAAEKIFPDDAAGFCRALYELGEAVAKSSGSILGFGGVGKEEKAALRIAAGVLGLK